MIELNQTQLATIMPNCRRPVEWTRHLNVAMQKYGIAEDRDFVCAFLAQIAVESAELNTLIENLNYSAAGLLLTWPNRFTPELANKLARRPMDIANHVYANRLGNGPPESGDGWEYRGRGLIQVTGKANTLKALAELGLSADQHTKLELPEYAAQSAGAYWARKPQLSALADDLPTDNDVADFFSITRLVNGGTVGIVERRKFWERAKAVL
jgi:putative chitinase